MKLHAVYRDRVELQRGGRLESLPFPHRSGDCWPARTTLQARTTRSNNCKACRMRTLQHCASAWTPCASRWKPRPSQNPPKKTRASPRPRLRKATDPMSQPLLRALFAPSSRSYVPAVLSLALGIQAAHAEKQRRERLRPGRQPAGGALDDQPQGCRHPRIHRPDFRNHRRDLRRRPAGQGPGQRGLQGPAR